MGLTFIRVKIINLADPQKEKEEELLVDSGAVYSIVSKEVLLSLGIKPHSKRIFILADGNKIEREIGDALFEYSGQKGASPVIFGESGDSAIFGTVSLEALGFILDPIKRELRPLPMILGYWD